MKSIRVILSTYFQLGFTSTLGLLFVMGAWLVATVHTIMKPADLTGSEPLWSVFLFALFCILLVSGINLKRLVITNTGVLFPRYRANHLILLVLLMTVFLVWPIMIMG
ncbi:MAG: hypothetical protein GY940_08890, partial [bacterium]|nr:hypothetical protein [bacterium]